MFGANAKKNPGMPIVKVLITVSSLSGLDPVMMIALCEELSGDCKPIIADRCLLG